MTIDELRAKFDEFLAEKGCDMTNEKVIEKALDTENKMFFAAK